MASPALTGPDQALLSGQPATGMARPQRYVPRAGAPVLRPPCCTNSEASAVSLLHEACCVTRVGETKELNSIQRL